MDGATERLRSIVTPARPPIDDALPGRLSPYLLVGAARHAFAVESLVKMKVTHVLNLAPRACADVAEKYADNAIAYLELDAEDAAGYTLFEQHLPAAREYLSRVLATVRDGPSTPPALRTFLRPPPFAAVASPAADCLAALPVRRPADSNLRRADRPLCAFGQHRVRVVPLTRWGLASRRRALPSRRWWPSCAGTPPTSACSAPAARGCAS